MSTYSELHDQINSCQTHAKLLAIVEHIVYNKRELKLDDYEVERLEESGIRRFEQINYENAALIRNRKH